MDTEKLQQLMRTFVLFHYWLLVWVFCDRTLNHRMNHIQERAFHEHRSDFGSLLDKTNLVTMPVGNLQLHMTERFKNKISSKSTFHERYFY